MSVVWVTGISGAGKSTLADHLLANGHRAIDGDAAGFNRWVRRDTGAPVEDAPARVPPHWVDDHAWVIRPEAVRELAAATATSVTYLCASVENEVDVWDLLDEVVCLVIDEATLRHRLATRTTNRFGQHPDELEKILDWNRDIVAIYRRLGATIVDATRPVAEVAAEVLVVGAGLGR